LTLRKLTSLRVKNPKSTSSGRRSLSQTRTNNSPRTFTVATKVRNRYPTLLTKVARSKKNSKKVASQVKAIVSNLKVLMESKVNSRTVIKVPWVVQAKIRILATNKVAKIVVKVKASKHKALAKDNSQVATKALLVMQAKTSKVQVIRRVPKVTSKRLEKPSKAKNSPLTRLVILLNRTITNRKKQVGQVVKLSQTGKTGSLATVQAMM